jgi:MoaA/NifB/PqqE/SkfB family radical SAM enzyme
MPGEINLSAPLYAPAYRVEPFSAGKVLLDTDRAHWIAVNQAGFEVLSACNGGTIDGLSPPIPLTPLNAAGQAALSDPLPQGQRVARTSAAEAGPRAALASFLRAVARRGFLSNKPFLPVLYQGRASRLRLDRLHEFWVVPNYDCNLRCRHCYTIEQVMHNPARLSADAACAIIDEAKALGAEIFYFTGGEVLGHPDIHRMIEHVTTDRKAIVFTNGMFIDDAVAERLARSRDRLIVQVSIEGPDEAVNRLIRGNGAFAPAWQGVRNCLRHGVRVGVSSTPCKAAVDALPRLTEKLCELRENGRGVEYHHLIMLLDVGGVLKNVKRTRVTADEYSGVLARCVQAAAEGRHRHGSRLVVANEKINQACAAHGPRKDFCGAGYTILGVDPEGNLKTCAATINDSKYNLGRLLNPDGAYTAGTLERLWRQGDKTQWVRNFTLARRPGEPADDLRYFHGGACWYNMSDPEQPLSTAHPFYRSLEDGTLAAIIAEAEKAVSGSPAQTAAQRTTANEKPGTEPRLLAYMHRHRIACAGARKTIDESAEGLDIGYCICFA